MLHPLMCFSMLEKLPVAAFLYGYGEIQWEIIRFQKIILIIY